MFSQGFVNSWFSLPLLMMKCSTFSLMEDVSPHKPRFRLPRWAMHVICQVQLLSGFLEGLIIPNLHACGDPCCHRSNPRCHFSSATVPSLDNQRVHKLSRGMQANAVWVQGLSIMTMTFGGPCSTSFTGHRTCCLMLSKWFLTWTFPRLKVKLIDGWCKEMPLRTG